MGDTKMSIQYPQKINRDPSNKKETSTNRKTPKL